MNTFHPPLKGIRVLDLTRALAGPFCTTLLADLGADVIKVESPNGDVIRQWGPFYEGVSLYHLAVNRNKRSVVVDSRTDEGRKMLRTMVQRSDVVVENFRRGVMEEMGLGPAWTSIHAPNTVIASISGFGPVGPLSSHPAFDQIAQGMAGLMSVTGPVDGDPMRVGIPIADVLSGMFAAIGVTAALTGRARGGHHTQVETSLLESVLGVLTFQAQRYLTGGEVPKSTGNDHPVISPYGVYATADRPLNLAVATQQQFSALCDVIGAPELAADERFLTGQDRTLHREDLRVELERRLIVKSAEDWLPQMYGRHVPAGAVNDMAAVFAEPQVAALDMLRTVTHSRLGDVQVMRGPLRIDGSPVPVERPAPALGEHHDEILRELGLGDAPVTGDGSTPTSGPTAMGHGA